MKKNKHKTEQKKKLEGEIKDLKDAISQGLEAIKSDPLLEGIDEDTVETVKVLVEDQSKRDRNEVDLENEIKQMQQSTEHNQSLLANTSNLRMISTIKLALVISKSQLKIYNLMLEIKKKEKELAKP